MDGSFAHIIQKQVFETIFSSKNEALKNQQNLAEVFQRNLVPLMANIFDKLVPSDKMYLIEKIELDLGTIGWEKFEENLSIKLEKMLEEVVLSKIHKINKTTVPKSKSPLSNSVKDLTGRGVSISLQDAEMEAFLFFLQKGHRPWWAANYILIQGKDSISELLSKSGNHLRKTVCDLLGKDTVRKRLLNNFPKSDLEALLGIERITNFLENLSLDFERIGKKIGHPLKDKAKIIFFLWTIFLEFLSKQPKITERLSVAFQQKAKPTKRFKHLSKTTLSALEKSRLIAVVFEVWIQSLFNQKNNPNLKKEDDPLNLFFVYLESQTSYSSTDLKKYVRKNLNNWKKNRALDSIFRKQNTSFSNDKIGIDNRPEIPKIVKQRLLDQKEKNQSFEIPNAGLVILTPFLPHFFKGLGLVKEKEFINEEAQNRALLLTQYLVDQKTSFDEIDLLLSKTLCGFDWSEAVELSFDPTKKEREEAEHLLTNVVTSWKALKSTSVIGFREAFLSRSGMIEEKEGYFSIRAERITIDVLLDKLPWGISLVKFPWMPKPLHVEW